MYRCQKSCLNILFYKEERKNRFPMYVDKSVSAKLVDSGENNFTVYKDLEPNEFNETIGSKEINKTKAAGEEIPEFEELPSSEGIPKNSFE